MIRLRDGTGKVIALPQSARFVEITDQAGAVAMVIYQDDKGAVHTFNTADTAEMQRYHKLMKVPVCPLVKLPG